MHLYYALLGLSVVIGLAGQTLLKIGMRRFSGTDIESTGTALSIIFKAALSAPILGGGLLYAVGFAVWLLVLTKIELSIAYPMLAVNYVLITILAWLFLGEPLNAYKVVGCVLIMSGVVVLSRGTSTPRHEAQRVSPTTISSSAAPPRID